jgi:hypothetical protein
LISAGDFLSFIEKIRKGIAQGLRQQLHFVGRILRIIFDVVGTDRDESDAFPLIILNQGYQCGQNVFDVRAMIADERDRGRFTALQISQTAWLARDHIGQREIGGLRSQRTHR